MTLIAEHVDVVVCYDESSHMINNLIKYCYFNPQKKVCEGTDSLAKLLNSYQAEVRINSH